MTSLVVHTAIDNLGKGAAGQALQCFNIIFEFDEKLGLSQVGVYPYLVVPLTLRFGI